MNFREIPIIVLTFLKYLVTKKNNTGTKAILGRIQIQSDLRKVGTEGMGENHKATLLDRRTWEPEIGQTSQT